MSNLQDHIRKALREGTQRKSLDEIRKQGFDKVKVIDAARINDLIFAAVEKAIAERSASLLDEERVRLQGSARSEFQNLLKEQQRAVRRAEQVEQAKAALEAEMRALTSNAGVASPAAVKAQMAKMHQRQKVMLDKYTALDELKREREAGLVEAKLKLDQAYKEIEKMKARGAAAPSAFIDEIDELRRQREQLRAHEYILKRLAQNAAIAEYVRSKNRKPPSPPDYGKGVRILLGDTSTPRTGITVRRVGSELTVEFPHDRRPTPAPGGAPTAFKTTVRKRPGVPGATP